MQTDKAERSHIYVGTQVDTPGGGFYALWLDEATGGLSEPHPAAAIERPTWQLRHPVLPVLYSVSEVGNRDAREGRLHALSIGPDGALTPLNDVPAGGGGPTHLDIDPQGQTLFVANFGGAQAVCIALQPDGRLGSDLAIRKQEGSGPHRRQKAAHPHGVTLDPTGRFLLVPDMGADRIFIHGCDPVTGQFTDSPPQEVATPAGSGPRLTLFGADGRFAYMLSELSAELFVFGWDAETGSLEALQSVPLDEDGAEGEPSAAAFTMSADGRFLYASNRRTHAIEAYAVDPEAGLIAHVQTIPSGGEKPWNANISPSGNWLLVTNQASDNVAVFRRNTQSGELAPVKQAPAQIPTPTCVTFSGVTA